MLHACTGKHTIVPGMSWLLPGVQVEDACSTTADSWLTGPARSAGSTSPRCCQGSAPSSGSRERVGMDVSGQVSGCASPPGPRRARTGGSTGSARLLRRTLLPEGTHKRGLVSKASLHTALLPRQHCTRVHEGLSASAGDFQTPRTPLMGTPRILPRDPHLAAMASLSRRVVPALPARCPGTASAARLPPGHRSGDTTTPGWRGPGCWRPAEQMQSKRCRQASQWPCRHPLSP